jgi:hypothetical protein
MIDEKTENTNGTAPVENGQAQDKGRKRTPPSRTLPSDRLAFAKQLAALRAYTVVYESNGNKPVTNNAAGDVINMAGSTLLVTNPFFCEMKLLKRQTDTESDEAAFVPTAEALTYHKAYEWDPGTAGEKMKGLFERTWFAEALVPRLKFREYEDREALTVLAEACGATKEYEERLKVLLDYMAFAGVIVREGGKIRAVSGRMAERASEPAPAVASPETREAPQAVPSDLAEFVFILDPKVKRRVILQAPHDLNKKEVGRVMKWMKVQFEMDDEPAPTPIISAP